MTTIPLKAGGVRGPAILFPVEAHVNQTVDFREKVDQALDLIRDTLRRYQRVAVACSFGKDSMVTVHLARRVKPDIPIFCITTPFKPPETDAYRERMAKAWNLNLTVFVQEDDLGARDKQLWKRDPDRCCEYFKVEPTRKAVAELDAWICGLRRTEGRTRADYDFVETRGGLVKVNPILDFTEAEIWLYHALHGIPPHPLYAEGFRSLGCAPCSAPGGELERSGRWLGTAKEGGECGIHTRTLKAGTPTMAGLAITGRCLSCGAAQTLPAPGEEPVCALCGKKPLFLGSAFTARVKAGMDPAPPRQVCAVELGVDESVVYDNGCAVTPLWQRRELSDLAGLPNLWVKYETIQPTGTFKARSALYIMTWLRAHGITEYVVSSTGNAGAALAQAAQAAGVKLHVFMPRDVAPGRVAALSRFGARVDAESRTYDDAKDASKVFAQERGIVADAGGMNPLCLGSMKTVAYEVFAQLGGRAPDWYVQAVSGGVGPVGVLAAFVEMRDAGLIDAVPRLLAVQPAGCAPMVTSWAAGKRDDYDVLDAPQTRVTTLGTGKPGLYPAIYDLCRQTPGSHFVAIDDDAADHYQTILAGYDIVGENTVGCAFAGMLEAVRQGVITPDQTVVFMCSGRGMGSA